MVASGPWDIIMRKKHNTIDICGEKWTLKFPRSESNASFASTGTHIGYIKIGKKHRDTQSFINDLVHECIEAILTTDLKRWYDKWDGEKEQRGILCVFDHQYLSALAPKIVTALLSTGFFEVQDLPKLRREE